MRITLLLLTTFLFSCAEQFPQTEASNNTQGKSRSGLLEGTWISLCEQGTIEYVQSHITFAAGVYHQEIQFHPDANCLIKNKIASSINGFYEIGNEINASDGTLVHELNITINDNGNNLKYLDIFAIQDGVLYFGTTLNNDSRPATLDWAYPYLKN